MSKNASTATPTATGMMGNFLAAGASSPEPVPPGEGPAPGRWRTRSRNGGGARPEPGGAAGGCTAGRRRCEKSVVVGTLNLDETGVEGADRESDEESESDEASTAPSASEELGTTET